ncbi:MAG: TonB-dependent receptor [Bryobacterales bacterium]|nr:TonB-dependent receptor [Bryobacterales bacterium]
MRKKIAARISMFMFLAGLALTLPPAGYSQEITGTVLGSVSDDTGAVVPGVKVDIRNIGTNVTRTYTTNEAGLYAFPFLNPGNYELTVEAAGFQRFVQQNIILEVNQRLRIPVTMTVGAVTENVTVTGAPPALETASGSLGQTIDSRPIAQLPNLNRNPLNIVFLSPGLSPNNFDRESSTAAATMGSINGGRADDNEVLLDGGSTISLSSNIAVLNPNIDTVAEVRIQTNSYSAEFGRAVGGTVNVTTKSGTNEVHGTLFEFHRNAAFTARNFFDGKEPRFTRNQFGGAVGGPVYLPKVYDGRNRTFFFASFEGIRQTLGLTNIGTLPSEAMRSGDFTGLPAVYDPMTTAVRDGVQGRLTFPGNRIPSSRFDSVSSNILKYYPLPTRAGSVNNFTLSLPTTSVEDRIAARIDHNVGVKNKFFGRYLYDDPRNSTTNNGPRTLPDARVDPSLPQQPKSYQWVLGDTHLFSPRTLNEFRFTFFRFLSTQYPGSLNLGFPSQLGLKGVDQALFPRVDITGFLPLGHASVNDTRQNLFSWSDTVSHTVGSHTLKFGFAASRFQFNNRGKGVLSGSFSFNQLPTAQVGQATTGNPLASFLLGFPISSSLETIRPTFGHRWTNFGQFVQDEIRISSRLTLNLGLRYEIETPLIEVNDLQSTFDVRKRGFVFAGADGAPRRLSDTDYHNFGPRLGFAWTPRANGKFVVRGGYGGFYASTSSSQVQQSRATGFTATGLFPSPDNGVTLPIKLDQGLPRIVIDPRAATNAQNISTNVIERNSKRAQIHQWNLNLERQFGDFLVQVAYAGSKGTHLIASSYNINQVPTALLGPGNAQTKRPFPDFQNITVNNPNAATSIYNGFYASVNRRLSRGLTLITSFTVHKSIDSSSGRGAFIEYGGLGPQDNYDRRTERGISQFDRTKRYVAGWVYELPAGNRQGLAKLLLAGWESSGIVEFMDGTPLAMTNTPNQTNSLGGGARPNRAAGVSPSLDNRTPARYFNTSAFVAPPQFTFGNASRTEPSLRTPGWATVDFSMLKNFALGERRSLQFRAESFNLTNRTNFQRPNTVLGTPQFGQILAAWAPRRIQFGLKVIF